METPTQITEDILQNFQVKVKKLTSLSSVWDSQGTMSHTQVSIWSSTPVRSLLTKSRVRVPIHHSVIFTYFSASFTFLIFLILLCLQSFFIFFTFHFLVLTLFTALCTNPLFSYIIPPGACVSGSLCVSRSEGPFEGTGLKQISRDRNNRLRDHTI